MNRIYKGYVGGDTLYHIEGDTILEPFGGAPVASISGNQIYFGRRTDSRPGGTMMSTSGGWEVFCGRGNTGAPMGFISGDGEHLMDRRNGEVLMSLDHSDPDALAMACVVRFGDDSLRECEDMRNIESSWDGGGDFYDYPTENAHPGQSWDDYHSTARRNAGFDRHRSVSGPVEDIHDVIERKERRRKSREYRPGSNGYIGYYDPEIDIKNFKKWIKAGEMVPYKFNLLKSYLKIIASIISLLVGMVYIYRLFEGCNGAMLLFQPAWLIVWLIMIFPRGIMDLVGTKGDIIKLKHLKYSAMKKFPEEFDFSADELPDDIDEE